MVTSRSGQRRWALLSVPIVAILLVVPFLYVITASTQPADGDEAGTGSPASPTAIAKGEAPQLAVGQGARIDQQPVLPVQTVATAAPTAEPLAIVNGSALFPRELQDAIAIDAMMASLAGQSPTSPALLLEQLINTLLIVQDAGSNPPTIDTAAYLAAILQAYGREPSTLDQALAAASIDRERFDAFVSQLAVADALARAKQADDGQAPADYVRDLQQRAQISFGSEASAILTAAAPVDASAPNPTDDAGVSMAAPAAAEVSEAAPSISDEPRGTETGQLAPDFLLPTLSEGLGEFGLRNLWDSPTVLIFWTTWCPYCLRQTPVLVEAHKQWSQRGIQFVGINVKEERSSVEPYVAEHGIAYPILLDADGATASAYAVPGYPTTYFLDANNRIVARHVGALTKEQLDSYLLTLRSAE